MSRIIRPVVSPRGRVIVLSGATLWLIATMLLSAAPHGAAADEVPANAAGLVAFANVDSFETVAGVDGVLFYPKLAVGPKGAVHLIDEGGARVIRLAGGDEIRADLVFGRKGAGPGEFMHPNDLAIDADGNVFVADLALGRVSKFAADGSFVASVALPHAAQLVVDSQGRVIAYPGRGPALLQRFDNELAKEEPLLAKSDPDMHRVPLGVLMAMDSADHLYLLDQAGPRLVVHDADMQPIDEWNFDDAPGLLEAIETQEKKMAEKLGTQGEVAGVSGIQAMALDAANRQIVFAYIVRPADKERFTRVAAYSTAGHFGWSVDRDNRVLANAFTRSGELLEGDAERVTIWGPQDTTRAGDN